MRVYFNKRVHMSISIRPAVLADAPQIHQFICDLAEYEKALSSVKCSPESLSRSLFEDDAIAYAMMIEADGVPIGYVIYFYNYSTWEAARGLYLEDLYVDPAHRGKGAGMLAMQSLAALAIDKDCKRFEWSVLDWNKPSIDFYEAIGAKAQSEWIGYRLEGEALENMAK